MTHQPWLGFDETRLTPQRAHAGVGEVLAGRVVDRDLGPLAFVDVVVVPPGASIGRHTHRDDEEIYVVVSGAADMVVDDQHRVVGAGDVIHNRAGGTHELHNHGRDELRMVVVDIRTPDPSP